MADRDDAHEDAAFAATIAPVAAPVAAPLDSGETLPASTTPRDPAAASSLPEVPYEQFKVDHEIARGGMGKIVAADDVRLARKVALKVLLEPAGDQLERFQREALITARLQHPGIVPVYEAGRWPSGEPFFAMKLVHGKPLDEVIAKAASFEARLALLPHVGVAAEAIAYAHSQRIVHRDLKPANVLVGDFGETVVIDWGLAKDLDAAETSVDRTPQPRAAGKRDAPTSLSSTLTVAGAVMGTPAYMAPEQARGEPVDQRVDVFALGAMIYHLLAGTPPYRARTATDVIAAAALGRIVPLVDHVHRAPADLVAIVDRAMAQDPAARYADAGELAAELRRFLTGQLVAAHRYTVAQRVARFVRRHRAAVTIGAVAVVALTAGGTVAIRDVIAARDRADAERDVAVIRKQAAEQLIDDTVAETETQLRAIGRLEVLAHLGTGLERYFDRLAAVPGGLSRDDVARMAEAIELIGEAEQKAGKSDAALQAWAMARARLVVAIALPGEDTVEDARRRRRELARLDFEIATNYQQRGRIPDAMRELDASKQVYAALRADGDTGRDVLLGDAASRDRLGDLLRNDGKIDAALAEYATAKTDREAAVALGDDATTRRALATSHVELGHAMEARGDLAAALGELQAALTLRQTIAAAEPGDLDLQHELLDADDELGDVERQIGDDTAAIETYEAARPVVAELIARDRDNQVWKRQQAILDADLGLVQTDRGDFRDALASLGRAIAVQRAAMAADPQSTFWQGDLSRSLNRSGDAHVALGELDDATAAYREGLALRAALVARNPRSVPFRRALAWSHAMLGDALAARGDAAGAIAEHEQAMVLRAQLVDESPGPRAFKDELAQTQFALGRALLAGDAAAANRGGELIAAGLALARTDVDADRLNTDWQVTLVVGLLARAEAARIAGDRSARQAALADALAAATAAAARATQSAQLPGYVAEIHAAMAELATTPAAARAEWDKARAALAPLAAATRLPAARRPLLDRAIAGAR
jgi:tetratricopeptide (TPR) repeat protein